MPAKSSAVPARQNATGKPDKSTTKVAINIARG
jgi:hypothetical protein